MGVEQIVPGVYQVSLGIVNAYLLEDGEGLVLVDTGLSRSEGKLLAAVKALGRSPGDVRQILLTHLHFDHVGSLAAMKRATGAPAAMHAADAALVREGRASREVRAAPGLLPWLIKNLFIRRPAGVEGVEIEHELTGGEELPLAGGIQVVHAPGHSAGQVAFFLPRAGGVLIAADTAGNLLNRLGYSIVYEDLEEGRRTLQKLAAMEFEVALFGHGPAITSGASSRFRAKWGA